MVRRFAVSSLILFGFLVAFSLRPGIAQDSSFTVTTAQAWTDTGLDLQAGDTVQITVTAAASSISQPGAAANPQCDPQGISSGSQLSALPLPSAPLGALLARLHRQGATPILIGRSGELHIEEPAHLFLGVNFAGTLPCQGNFLVTIHRVTASGTSGANFPAQGGAPAGSGTASPSAAKSETRAEQLKSQLGTAAQIFMQGQFGMGNSGASGNAASNAASNGSSETASAAPALSISSASLDAGLGKDIDGLPRRVNDQFKNLGDMVNFVIVGSQQNLQAALAAASWHPADIGDEKAALNAVEATLGNKDYLQMPMSTLYLFGRAQDVGYEMAEPIAMVASRHHFRIWKAPFTWKGQQVWVGAGTHDIGFAKDKRNGSVTHKIDPKVDGERDNIGSSLQKASKVKTLWYYLPPNPVQEAKNATGDSYQSDGRLLVILLQ